MTISVRNEDELDLDLILDKVSIIIIIIIIIIITFRSPGSQPQLTTLKRSLKVSN